jgi:hypothetical protein
MINAEERSQAQSASQGGVSQTSNSIPKCVCGWKNCRVYQKAYREAKHAVMDGAIKLRLSRNDPEQAALKSSIDRALKVTPTKRHDWKTDSRHQQSSQGGGQGGGAAASSPGDYIKYTIARHHWTEKHMMKYLNDPENYSFSKPFSVHGANKYLYTVDQRETIKLEADGDLLDLQTPTVPKEIVKQHFMNLKIATPAKAPAAASAAASAAAPLDDNNRSEHKQSSRTQQSQNGQSQNGHNSTKRAGVDKKASNATASTKTTTLASTTLEEQQVLSTAKEEENVRLKDQLEAMQGQLSFLHDMVRKLQEEHYDHQSTKSGLTGKSGGLSSKRASGHSRQRTSSAHSRSGRSGKRTGDVPHEIQLSEEGGEDWNDWYDEDETTVRENEQEDDETTATFQVPYNAPERRNSNTSKASKATTIVSASTSIKALPREIELDEDEDDSEDHDSLEEEAFDNRSFASSRHSSRHGSRRNAEEQQSRRSSAGAGSGTHSKQARRPSSGQSINSNKMGSVSSRSSKRRHNLSVSRRKSIGSESNKSVSWDKESEHGSTAGVYQVKALTMTDPYGEQGTYTGSISNSTSMPHGFGRLEYDRAGRWYEGDWKHGRWTGQGKLSNGDGDFYEGGLKNDHKHGLGVMRFADGRIFEGEYINGQMIEGKMSYQDGSTYEGSWVDGMRHGRGKCVFTDQSVYEGDFREGEFFGFGKMGWSDGGWYEGEWWNGEMHGRGKEIRPDGSIRHEGDWAKGQPIRK